MSKKNNNRKNSLEALEGIKIVDEVKEIIESANKEEKEVTVVDVRPVSEVIEDKIVASVKETSPNIRAVKTTLTLGNENYKYLVTSNSEEDSDTTVISIINNDHTVDNIVIDFVHNKLKINKILAETDTVDLETGDSTAIASNEIPVSGRVYETKFSIDGFYVPLYILLAHHINCVKSTNRSVASSAHMLGIKPVALTRVEVVNGEDFDTATIDLNVYNESDEKVDVESCLDDEILALEDIKDNKLFIALINENKIRPELIPDVENHDIEEIVVEEEEAKEEVKETKTVVEEEVKKVESSVEAKEEETVVIEEKKEETVVEEVKETLTKEDLNILYYSSVEELIKISNSMTEEELSKVTLVKGTKSDMENKTVSEIIDTIIDTAVGAPKDLATDLKKNDTDVIVQNTGFVLVDNTVTETVEETINIEIVDDVKAEEIKAKIKEVKEEAKTEVVDDEETNGIEAYSYVAKYLVSYLKHGEGQELHSQFTDKEYKENPEFIFFIIGKAINTLSAQNTLFRSKLCTIANEQCVSRKLELIEAVTSCKLDKLLPSQYVALYTYLHKQFRLSKYSILNSDILDNLEIIENNNNRFVDTKGKFGWAEKNVYNNLRYKNYKSVI